MPRLPIPGSDEFKWGHILNEFLAAGHNPDGSHKVIPVSQGGTGASDTATARENLAVYSKEEVDTFTISHVEAANDAHAATAISFTPAGDLSSTNVQAAIEELAAETGASIVLSNEDPEDLAAEADSGNSAQLARADHVHSYNGLATSDDLADHAADTTNIHGIADTAQLETVTGSQAKVNAHVAATDPHTQYLTETRHDALDHTAALASATIADLGDVTATAPTDGQALIWDDDANTWAPGDAGVNDHGDLTGLADDDHPQYLLRDDTAAAVGSNTFRLQVAGDTDQRFIINGGGALEWGDGTNPVDTNLYRASADTLKTDDALVSGSLLRVDRGANDAILSLRNTTDENQIYTHSSTGDLRFWNGSDWVTITPTGNVGLGTTSGINSKLTFVAATTAAGGITFGTDTNLYRSAANVLKTDDTFVAPRINANPALGAIGLSLYVGSETFPRISLSDSQIHFGSGSGAVDTNLYRSNANELKTDDSLVVAGQFWSNPAAFSTYSINMLVQGEVTERFRIRGDGLMQWSDGTNAHDVNLYRSGADTLRTDDNFYVGGTLTTNTTITAASLTGSGDLTARDGSATETLVGDVSGNSGILFGSASDTNLYRSAADTLKTDDSLIVAGSNGISSTAGPIDVYRTGTSNIGFSARLSTDSVARYAVYADGKVEWGDGSVARDTNLYRSAADTLKTDDNFFSALNIVARQSVGSQVALGNYGPGGEAAVVLGSWDTNLYRSAANTLKTDDSFVVGGTLILSGDPSSALQAATKQYVDAAVNNQDSKISVRAATTANITLSGAQTIDGVSVIAGDRVLVKDQSTASQNGIYVVASGSWSRAADADASSELNSGLFTYVSEGTANGGVAYVLTTPDPITLGTTSLTFARFSSPNDHGSLSGLTDDDHSQYLLTSGSRTTSGVTLTAAAATDNVFRLHGAASQSGSLQIWQDGSGGTLSLNVDNGGRFRFKHSAVSYNSMAIRSNGRVGFNADPTAQVHITPDAAATIGLIVQGAASQSGDLQQWQDSTGTALVRITSNGQSLWTMPTSSHAAIDFRATGDSTGRFVTTAGGQLEWGPGNAARDTNLYRASANALSTDDWFYAAGRITARNGSSAAVQIGDNGPSNAAGITFGSDADTNLYRSAANVLRTDDNFFSGSDIYAQAGNSTQVRMGSGTGNPGLIFGTDGDTNLYRAGANMLKTDDQLQVGGDIVSSLNVYGRYSTASQVGIGNVGPSAKAGVSFGSAGDTNLYRDSANVLKTDDSLVVGGNLTLTNNPTDDMHAATKSYVDAVASGLDPKASVRVATTDDITLSGEQTIDSVAVVTGDRVLVKDQTDGSENGIYIASAGAWSRAEDADTSSEVTPGLFCFVEEGTASGNTGWVLITDGPITLGTTNLSFERFTSQNDHGVLQGLDDDDHPQYLLTNGERTTTGVTLIAASVGTDNLSFKVSGDSVARHIIDADGRLEWGPGNAAVDTNLYRTAANALRTDGSLTAASFNGTISSSGSRIFRGLVSGDSQSRFEINNAGEMLWGGGSSAPDVKLYRSAADTLKTDDQFLSAHNIVARSGTGGQVRLGLDDNLALIYFGSANDTNLYRSAADTLKTDDGFIVGTGLAIAAGGGSTPATDISLKIAANSTSTLNVSSNADSTTAAGGIHFGSSRDTNLYRSAANTLKTDDVFNANGYRLNGAGNYYQAFNEDRAQVKYANWFNNLNDQWGQGQLYHEMFFLGVGASSIRRLGFYTDRPNSGGVDTASPTTQPTNWRMIITTTGTQMQALAATDVPLTIKGSASQSANLQEWQDSDNNVLASIDEEGNASFAGLSVGGGAVATDDIATFGYEGALTVKTGKGRFRLPYAATILGVSAAVDTVPTGSAIILDVNINGTTIFTTQANRPTIAANTNDAEEVTNMDVAAVASGDYITVDIDQVGSTVAGSDLTVFVRYKRA